jgi:hypothetical protein
MPIDEKPHHRLVDKRPIRDAKGKTHGVGVTRKRKLTARHGGVFTRRSPRAPSIRRFIRASRIVERRIDVDDERQLMIALIENYNF